MAAMDAGLLPMIKCSNCGIGVEISAMGDHVCAKVPATSPSPSPPPPPPKSDYDIQPKSTGRSGLPPPINPLIANRPFLRPDNAVGVQNARTPTPLSASPLRPVQRSQTTPLIEPQSPEFFDLNSAFPRFPLPRSMSAKESGAMATLKDTISAPPVPSPQYAQAMSRQEAPATAGLPVKIEQGTPPPPLPKDNVHQSTVPGIAHRYGNSVDSKSSYRTSFASSRYGDTNSRHSRRSTAMSGRRPSFGSVSHAYKYLDDAPPVPSAPPQSVLRDSSVVGDSAKRQGSINNEDKSENYKGFDFGTSTEQTSDKTNNDQGDTGPLRVSSNTNSERLSSNRGSAELFFRSPSQSSFGLPTDFTDLSDERPAASSTAPPAKVEYKAFKAPSTDYLQPAALQMGHHDEEEDGDFHRRLSDATSDGGLSMSNFARALGLDISNSGAVDNSTVSSDSSPSEIHSGTSFSSLASDASTSRRKPSDQGRLGRVVEGLQTANFPERVLGGDHTESPIGLEPPPRIPDLFSPDSPTDPAIVQGSVSLIPDQPQGPKEESTEQHPMFRTVTEPSRSQRLRIEPLRTVSPLTEPPRIQSPQKDTPEIEPLRSESPPDFPPRKESLGMESPRQEESSQARSPQVVSPQVESHRTESPREESVRTQSPPVVSPRAETIRKESPKEEPLRTDSPRSEHHRTHSPRIEQPRPSPRPKGPCRGCGDMIMGKSVSSADGRLTGRYHRGCFVCYDCRTPFQTADFYVLNDLPYCAQHYHQRNGSLCQTCHTGIEGQYLETDERRGRGPGDRQKFHPNCLACRTCNVILKGDYFEWNGQVYCERDARRAAASVPPPRFRRPGQGPSPLAPHPEHARGPSRGYPMPPGYPGRGGGGSLHPGAEFGGPYRPPPSGARRFPERRTTKLMMI